MSSILAAKRLAFEVLSDQLDVHVSWATEGVALEEVVVGSSKSKRTFTVIRRGVPPLDETYQFRVAVNVVRPSVSRDDMACELRAWELAEEIETVLREDGRAEGVFFQRPVEVEQYPVAVDKAVGCQVELVFEGTARI